MNIIVSFYRNMDNNLKELLDKVRKIVENSLDKDEIYNINVSIEENVPELVQASMDLFNWNISIKVNKNIEEKLKEYKKKFGAKNPLSSLIFATIRHEIGHHRVCPMDLSYTKEITKGINKALIEEGIDEKGAMEYFPNILNWFSDVIVNTFEGTMGKDPEKFKEGMSILYYYGGRGKLPYAVSMKLQQKLYGLNVKLEDKLDKEVIDKADKISNRILEGWNRITKNNLNNLFVPNNWREMAYIFTKELIRGLMEDSGKYSLPLSSLDCPFSKEFVENRSLLREILQTLSEEYPGRGTKGLKRVSETNPIISELKKYLKSKAKDLVFEIFKGKDKNGDDIAYLYPMTYMVKKRTYALDGKLAWAETKFVRRKDDEEVWIFKKENPYTTSIPVGLERRNVNDLLFIIDVSGSMFDKITLDSSPFSLREYLGTKWELAVRAFLGVVEYLRRKRIGREIRYGVITFSDTTNFSGWKREHEIDDLLNFLIENMERGPTYLDTEVILRALAKKGNQSQRETTIVLLTDGLIENEREVYETLLLLRKQNHRIIHFQIGEHSQLEEELRKSGIPTIYIDNPSDLDKVVITETIKQYRTY